ncbi:hypothetical protein CROQUDRAFT_97340 [Cronartium quercuum f. sp. fusiforme G11]|uniref:Uncharacterized protein n=1 Tax=Cronartium quercuum f. sp. fusiforme G11 TaxID=708437 RepID=A0A9P6NBM8_9BASI|nr:hypothetical protein CROQUDRAFT_97340 [Cronartium quercuum f. sp. fusiforme G11]
MFLDHFGAPHQSKNNDKKLKTPRPLSSSSSLRHKPDSETMVARNPNKPLHTDPPYKSLNFYIKMPSLVKNLLVILDVAGTKFLAWKNQLWDTINYVTTIDNYLATD